MYSVRAKSRQAVYHTGLAVFAGGFLKGNTTTSTWRAIAPSELWARRHLAWMLSVREIKVRYKQSALGAAWAVIRPLVMMVVFTFLFGTLAQLPDEGVPYPIYVFAALIGWDLFANVVLGSATSITANKSVVQKVYCPRLLFPLSSLLVALFDFVIAAAILTVLMVFMDVTPSANIVWLPLLVIAVLLVGLSIGLWLAAAAVWLHDIKFVVGYLIQLVMLLTPVGYGAKNIPESLSWIITINPMATLVELFRWSILGVAAPDAMYIGYAAAATGVLLAGGLYFFNALERSFADVV